MNFRRFIIALCLLSVSARAELTTGASAPPPSPSPQQIDPTQASQQAQNEDRSDKGGTANAAAIAGAAVNMAMCAMLMKQAQEAKAAGDTQGAQMYMMMAMQQCGQGAQNLANAKQNDDNKNAMKAFDDKKPTASPTPSPQIAQNAPQPQVEKETPTESPTPEVEASPSPSPVEKKTIASLSPVGQPESETSALAPMEANLTYDENAKRQEVGPAPSSIPNGMGNTFARSLASTGDPSLAGGAGLAGMSDGDGSGRRRKKGQEGAEGSEGGGESAATGKAGPDSFDNMLAQLMAPKTNPLDGLQFGSPESLNFGSAGDASGKSKERKMNLFQYAGLQYKKRAYIQKKLRVASR